MPYNLVLRGRNENGRIYFHVEEQNLPQWVMAVHGSRSGCWKWTASNGFQLGGDCYPELQENTLWLRGSTPSKNDEVMICRPRVWRRIVEAVAEFIDYIQGDPIPATLEEEFFNRK